MIDESSTRPRFLESTSLLQISSLSPTTVTENELNPNSHPWVKVHPTLAFHLTLTHPHYQNLKFSRILAIFTKICLQIFSKLRTN